MREFRLLSALLFTLFFGKSFSQITCDFNFINTGQRCVPYIIIDSAANTSSFPIVERKWYLTGPGGITYNVVNGQTNPTFNYSVTIAGNYCIRMWAMNSNGDSCSVTKCIDVNNRPVCNFTFSPTEGCAPLCVTESCNCTPGCGTINSMQIDWGCGPITGLSSCSGSVQHCYTCQPGCYSPIIVITNSCGCTTTDTSHRNAICIIPPLSACFTADTTAANCAANPLTVHFTGCSNTGNGIVYDWYINGQHTNADTGRLWTHAFPVNSNCYTIKLVVRHPSGCADSITKTDFICVRSVPQVCYTQNATTACVDCSNPFTLNLTSCSISSTWQLNPPTGPPSTQTGTTASFTGLCAIGTYKIIVTTAFGPGCIARDSSTLVLKQAPCANFIADDVFGCKTPHPVCFSASCAPSCAKYQWDIIGVGPAQRYPIVANPCVTFPNFGTFNVSLTVTDSCNGCSNSVTKPGFINVSHINPVVGQDRKAGCAPVCGHFWDATNYSNFPDVITSVCWKISGPVNIPNTCLTPPNPYSYCFTTPGCYLAQMIVTTNTGCVDSAYALDSVCVGVAPTCTITPNLTTICFEQEPIQFTLNCNPQITPPFQVDADYGLAEGKFIYYDNYVMLHSFTSGYGNFPCTFVVSSDSCPGQPITVNITVNSPAVKFKDSTNTCSSGNTVYFTNLTATANPAKTTYLWTFCDGTTSTLPNPVVILPSCTTCAVKLEAYDSVTNCHHQKIDTINTACGTASINVAPGDSGCGPTKQFFFTNSNPNATNTRWYYNCPSCTTSTGCANTQLVPQLNLIRPTGIHCVCMTSTVGGCPTSACTSVKVCTPLADFENDSACFPQQICFTYKGYDSICAITRHIWTFGDGTVDSVNLNPCHSYAQPGTYQATLFIQNEIGCTATVTKQVIVSSVVSVNYSMDTFMCPGKTHCITNTSTGVQLSFNWTFPNGTDTSPSPCFSINTAGDYWVYLDVYSAGLCHTRDSTLVHACVPHASGTATPTFFSCPSDTVPACFVSTSTCYDSLLIWNFGDQIHSNSEVTCHYYGYPGTYPIGLTVISRDGCVDSSWVDTIVVAGPYGNFTVLDSPGVCLCTDTVHFSVSTVNTVSLILLYGCNIGFCRTSPITPIGTPSNPTVINCQSTYCPQPPYSLTDTCIPQLLFGDSTGCFVHAIRQAVYIDSPEVRFTFNAYGACLTGTVCFFDSTKYHLLPYQSYTVKHIWDFGDGSIDSVNANPCHTYSGPGTYNPKLYIRSNLGCFDSIVSQTVIIPEFPVAAFYADDSVICANTSTCFHDTSSTDTLTAVAYRVWNFGDSPTMDTAYVPDICHTYTAGGFYRVTLCVYDSLGCPDCDSSIVIHVIDPPVANAGADRIVCYNIVTQLNGSGGVSCVWSPAGLVSDDSICNPTVQLTADATLTLEVTDRYQCKDTDTLNLRVARVFAAFNPGNTFCLKDSVCFTDASTGVNDTLQTFVFDFGVPPVASGSRVCHKYFATGNYTVLETVTDNNGCIDTATLDITVNPNPTAAFSIADSVICSNESLCVTDLSTGGTPPYSWQWNFGSGANVNGQTPPCHSYFPPYSPNYTVMLVVTDQNNCTDTARHITIVNEIPHANFDWTPSCETEKMPLASTSVAGDSPIGNCEWTFWLGAPSPVIDNNCTTSFQFPTGFHDVQLIVTDLNGCKDTIVKTVQTDSPTSVDINPGDTLICVSTTLDYVVTGTFTNLHWSPSIWLSSDTASSVTVTPLGNVTYFVTTVNGVCPPSRDSVTIRIIQRVPIDIVAAPECIILGLSSQITAQIPGRIDSIVWNPNATLSCTSCSNPQATPTQTTTYIATIFYSQEGVICSNSDSITICFLESCDEIPPFLPNTFTPNGDGLNDIFMIRGIAGRKFNYFRIFDRWGKLMFERANGQMNDPSWGWDGNDKEGKKLNPAVFVYTYEIECANGETKQGKGNVTLVR